MSIDGNVDAESSAPNDMSIDGSRDAESSASNGSAMGDLVHLSADVPSVDGSSETESSLSFSFPPNPDELSATAPIVTEGDSSEAEGARTLPAFPVLWDRKAPLDLLEQLRESGAGSPLNFLEYVTGGSDWCTPSSLELMHADFFQLEYLQRGRGLSQLFRPLFVPICATPSTLSLSWVLFSVLLAALLLEMGEDHRDKICMLMQLLMLKVANGTNLPVLLPSNEHEIATYYMGNGKIRRASFLESLPYPNHEELAGGFRYFPLPKLLQYAHASGHVLEPLHVISNRIINSSTFVHSCTPRGFEILSNALKLHGGYRGIPDVLDQSTIRDVQYHPESEAPTVGVFSCIIWSDSFEAASTKQNRGSVWVCFVSIATPSPVFNSGRNTFLLSVGPSGINHDAVFRRLVEDLRLINQPRCPLPTLSRSVGAPVRAYLFPYVLLQDTPEKTSSNGLASFTAKNASYYGYIMDIEEREGLLPSCVVCHRRRLATKYSTRDTDSEACPTSTCYDWNPPGLEAITWSGLVGYFESVLTQAVATGMSDRGVLTARLRLAGISPALAVTLGEFIRHRVMEGIPPGPTPPAPFPALWHDPPFFDVGDSIEVIMHQLFLGIVKSMAKDVFHPFLAGKSLWTSYSLAANDISSKLGRLNLHWMKILPMTDSGNHGGWVSENYLAFGRLLKYFSTIPEDTAGSEEEDYLDPLVPLEQFSLPQMKRWLSARSMDVCKPVNRTRVQRIDYLNTIRATGWKTPGDHPLPLRNPTRGTTFRQFHELVQSCYSLLCLVMSLRDAVTPEESWAVERAAKLYLSADDSFVDGVFVTPVAGRRIAALRKRNKINLLKLAPSLIRYGPFHLLTELGPKGEGAIQKVKPLVRKGQGTQREGWPKHVANAWARRHCLKTMIWMIIDAFRDAVSTDSGLPEDDLVFLRNGGKLFSQYFARTFPDDDNVVLFGVEGERYRKKTKSYHVYKSKEAVHRLLQAGRVPISAISAHEREGDAHFYATVYRDADGREMATHMSPKTLCCERAGCCFWEWGDVCAGEVSIHAMEELVIEEPITLLPFLGRGGRARDDVGDGRVDTPKYYAISHGWREMNREGEMVVYQV
jgi:hypothetical protein